jgi:hypothetical protein
MREPILVLVVKKMKAIGAYAVIIMVMISSVVMIIGPMNPTIPSVEAASTRASGPASVDLETSGDFVILSKSGISTTGTTLITGDIGVSPIAHTALTGFSETMDSSNEFSTSAYVIGKLYAADYTDPTPAKMTTAVSDMETAYTDAAGRTLPNATELGAGDISTLTIVPGLYKWGTGVNIDDRGVTLSGGADDVWIFQISGDLTVANGAIVTLSGGAKASNIFWQVGGGAGAILGTTSVFNGNILALKAIVLKTGATLNGRALAQTAVTLDANAVTEPSSVPIAIVFPPLIPYWMNTSPRTINATGSASSDSIELYYRYTVDNTTWGAWSTFGNDTAFPWGWSFTFPNGEGYYQFYTRAHDNATNFDAAPVEADQFCAYKITPPMVRSTIPADDAKGAAINSAITAIFSEVMNPLTITNSTFTLMRGATPVPGTVTYGGITATFTPESILENVTVYTATITTGAKDLAGNALAVDYVWTFTTGSAPDNTAPMVRSTIPADDAKGAAINSAITAIFSEVMNPLTITTSTFTLMQGATPVPGTVTYAGITATFTPESILENATAYTATITTGAKDLVGNALAIDYVWTFTTGSAPDNTAPMVRSTIPADDATGRSVYSAITAIFSEAMNPLTITTSTFTLMQGATPVPGTVTYAGITVTFTPESILETATIYTATITTGAKDLAGNALAVDYVWNFTTDDTATQGLIDLGLAGDFVILSKSGISTTGTTLITGDIGVSPIAHTALTGFSETMDSSNEFSTSAYVIGKLYAADYTDPTPAKMTTAVSDMETAYIDLAGRTLPDATELGAGDISTLTIVPGLYKWGTGVNIDDRGVTLSGSANGVWIFQISGDLTVANGAIVTLSGGAKASNIFWQVGGGAGAILGTTSVFNGNILALKAIVLKTGATLNGRALAQTAVTLDANSVQLMQIEFFDIEIGPMLYDDNTPAVNVTVILSGDTRADFEGKTNAAGYVVFQDKVPGSYMVKVVGPVDNVTFNLTLTPSGETVYATLPRLTASPDKIAVTIGPVKDTKGNPLVGAKVTLKIDGQTYTGTTDNSGNVVFQLPIGSKGKTMNITIVKDGYDKAEYNAVLGQDGKPTSSPPAMKKVSGEDGRDMTLIIIIFVIILVAIIAIIIGAFVSIGNRSKKAHDGTVMKGNMSEEEAHDKEEGDEEDKNEEE